MNQRIKNIKSNQNYEKLKKNNNLNRENDMYQNIPVQKKNYDFSNTRTISESTNISKEKNIQQNTTYFWYNIYRN